MLTCALLFQQRLSSLPRWTESTENNNTLKFLFPMRKCWVMVTRFISSFVQL